MIKIYVNTFWNFIKTINPVYGILTFAVLTFIITMVGAMLFLKFEDISGIFTTDNNDTKFKLSGSIFNIGFSNVNITDIKVQVNEERRMCWSLEGDIIDESSRIIFSSQALNFSNINPRLPNLDIPQLTHNKNHLRIPDAYSITNHVFHKEEINADLIITIRKNILQRVFSINPFSPYCKRKYKFKFKKVSDFRIIPERVSTPMVEETQQTKKEIKKMKKIIFIIFLIITVVGMVFIGKNYWVKHENNRIEEQKRTVFQKDYLKLKKIHEEILSIVTQISSLKTQLSMVDRSLFGNNRYQQRTLNKIGGQLSALREYKFKLALKYSLIASKVDSKFFLEKGLPIYKTLFNEYHLSEEKIIEIAKKEAEKERVEKEKEREVKSEELKEMLFKNDYYKYSKESTD